MSKLYLSKSRVNTYTLCAEKYRLKYVEKIEPEKKPTALLEGSALHYLIENSLVYGKDIPNIVDATSEEFWQNIRLEQTEYENAETFSKAKDNILNLAKTFIPIIGELNTYQLETYFEKPLTNPETGVINDDIIVHGYTDIIDSPQPGITRIIDIKTTGRTPNTSLANVAPELSMYAYMMAAEFGWHIKLPVSFLYLVKSKTPKVLWLNSERSLPDFMAIYRTLVNVATGIQNELFWKNYGQHCSWCQYHNLCYAQGQCAA